MKSNDTLNQKSILGILMRLAAFCWVLNCFIAAITAVLVFVGVDHYRQALYYSSFVVLTPLALIFVFGILYWIINGETPDESS